jgi:hypothetical protein
MPWALIPALESGSMISSPHDIAHRPSFVANRPPSFKGATCKGSYHLGSRCTQMSGIPKKLRKGKQFYRGEA